MLVNYSLLWMIMCPWDRKKFRFQFFRESRVVVAYTLHNKVFSKCACTHGHLLKTLGEWLNHKFALADAYYGRRTHAALLVTLGIRTNTVGVARTVYFRSNCIIWHIARNRYLSACETGPSCSSITSKGLCHIRCRSSLLSGKAKAWDWDC